MRPWLRMARLLVGIGWEIGPMVSLLYIGVSSIAFVGPLLLALGLRPLVDGIVYDRTVQLATGAALIAVALVLSVLAPAGYRWATIRMRERSIMVMQRRLLTLSTTARQLEHFERPAFWDRLQLLKLSSHDLGMGMALAFVGPIVVIQLVVMAALLAQLYPALLLVPLVALPATWLSRRAEALLREGELRSAEPRRVVQHLFMLASAAAPGREVRLYGLRGELLGRHSRESRRVHRIMERVLLRSASMTAGSWLLFTAVYVGAVMLVLREVANGRATPGDVALTLALATAVVGAAGRFSELAGSVLRILTASEHYHWLAEQARPRHDGAPASPPVRLERGVDLERVSFSYAEKDEPALCDVSLHLPAGAVVAVVGENGAGKTTMVKLLCGLYAPTGGRILIDGVDLANVDLDAYRQRLTAGFQDFMRFELVTREAVGVGELRRMKDVDAVRTALQKANAGFAERLPAGLETQLGASWQGGVDLSGGEWQKLAMARSLLRPAPLLVILDEPTASLDPQTEHRLFEQVAREARESHDDGRVTVLISHRFSTVRMADLIVVLDRGRIVDQGTHAELVARGGLYAELYELQAHAYR